MDEEKRETATETPGDGMGLATTVTVVVLAGGLVIPLLGGSVGATRGAQRSTELLRAERQTEIAKAIAKAQVAEAIQERANQQDR